MSHQDANAVSQEIVANALVVGFFSNLTAKLDEARQTSATPDGVMQVTLEEARQAIEAKRSWTRHLSDNEEWIVHQYLSYLEDRVASADGKSVVDDLCGRCAHAKSKHTIDALMDHRGCTDCGCTEFESAPEALPVSLSATENRLLTAAKQSRPLILNADEVSEIVTLSPRLLPLYTDTL